MMPQRIFRASCFSLFFTAIAASSTVFASAREEAKLLTATEVLEEIQAMPDQHRIRPVA